jgi:hypothetical protein
MPSTCTHLTHCPATEGQNALDGGSNISDRKVKVGTILDCFALGDAL